jgi:hypothetical protein
MLVDDFLVILGMEQALLALWKDFQRERSKEDWVLL